MDLIRKNRIVSEAKKAFNEAITIFLCKDNDLPIDIHERTTVSRIAHYMANLIEENFVFAEKNIKVDVEYNRNESETKRYDGQLMYVDLIVHRRGDNNPKTRDNILICEFKNNFCSVEDRDRITKMVQDDTYGYLIGTTMNLRRFRRGKATLADINWVLRDDSPLIKESETYERTD